MNEIRSYSGYFTFAEISDEEKDGVARRFGQEGFEVDLSERALEFEATARDEDRLIIKLFQHVATVVKDADGELQCEIDDESKDPHFEFFTIKGGALWIQRGQIVREDVIDSVQLG